MIIYHSFYVKGNFIGELIKMKYTKHNYITLNFNYSIYNFSYPHIFQKPKI